ncbi:MAG TPA: hypothetical protein IAC04_03320 [Candidatus Coprenecus stercoravium]|uniref:Lipoprotein n=1 Tax=Candidatus Coprenecus stercoravium TaxID=2840735 RepID=A0A9D2GQD8_9BACT|nr:hypothetical protein [Candidatus Coprenecus stercoravium]
MRRLIISLPLLFCLLAAVSSCATISRAQLEAVSELTFRSDTVSRSPVVLFGELADIRLERGLFYAASLSSGTSRFDELTALAEASMDDEVLVRKAGEYVDVFNSYVRALHSISSERRWKNIGTQMRGVGIRIDSVLYRYNRLDLLPDEVPLGYAKMTGRVLGYVAEEIIRAYQKEAVKNIVIMADTLVSASCDSLMNILRSKEMNALIEHEKQSLRDNYSAYLNAMEAEGRCVPSEYDRRYVELVRKADGLSDVRNRCVSALRSLKNAHASLAESFAAGEKEVTMEQYEDLVRLNRLAARVAEALR